jgi:hypothetical protein
MDGSSAVSHLGTMRIALALLVAGALSIGAAACGSSSSESTPSATVLEKEAGALGDGTRLTVLNKDAPGTRDAPGITVQICAVDVSCKEPQKLGVGDSVGAANDTSSTADVNGSIRYADGYEVKFEADNPDVGPPWISVNGEKFFPPDTTHGFQTDCCARHPFDFERDADISGYKTLTLAVSDAPPKYWDPGAGDLGHKPGD